MRILVTGGAGFIGSHVVEVYLAAGHEVRLIDDYATGRRANVPSEARLHAVDIHAREVEAIFEEFRARGREPSRRAAEREGELRRRGVRP